MTKYPSVEHYKSLLAGLRTEQKKHISALSRNWQIRSKANWIEKGEKSTKYFFQRYTIRTSQSVLQHVRQHPNKPQTKEETMEYVANWYQALYKTEDHDPDATTSLLRAITPASHLLANTLTKKIKKKDIINTIRQLPNNKSPGPDGLTYELYKKTATHIAPKLKTLFNSIMEGGEVPQSWTESYIILIPKKELGKDKIQNWRPIALINSDAKIFLKILAQRLAEIASKIIPHHQKGFLPARNTIDATLNIKTTWSALKDNKNDPAFLLQLDQQKAFDRVNHNYLIQVLKAFNLPPNFIRIIAAIIFEQKAAITDNQTFSKQFRLERGVRQGDPISPILFALAIEPFLATIAGLENNIPPHLSPVQAFADDTTLFATSNDHLQSILNTLSVYESASNAKANLDKSCLIPINTLAEELINTLPDLFTTFKTLNPDEKITILGFGFNTQGESHPSNWPTLIDKLQKKITQLSSRDLTLKGRSLTSNLLLASKIWYMSYIFPPTAGQRDIIQHLINNWAKKESRILPTPAIFQLPVHLGGWNLTNIKASIMARQTMMASKLMYSEENWAKYARQKILDYQREMTSICDTFLGSQWPKETRQIIKTWHLAGRPDYREITTRELVLYYKKDFTIKNSWPQEENPLWHDTKQLNILPQHHVTFWRWLTNTLPLREKTRWYQEGNSPLCDWCKAKHQTPKHLLNECSITLEIVQECRKKVRKPSIPYQTSRH